MILPITAFSALASVASAIPFKRFDNETTGGFAISSSPDATVTIDKYLTTTLSDHVANSLSLSDTTASEEDPLTTITQYVTMTIDGLATTSPVSTYTTSMADIEALTTITEYVTMTVDGFPTTSAVSTYTSSLLEVDVTSTFTSYVTITGSDGSIATEAITSAIESNETADVCVCIPSTVTVTATSSTVEEYSMITLVSVTSFPVTGEFTFSDMTTTITSFVEVTLTETSYSPLVLYTTSASFPSTPLEHPAASIMASSKLILNFATSSTTVAAQSTPSAVSSNPVYSSFKNETISTSGIARRAFKYDF